MSAAPFLEDTTSVLADGHEQIVRVHATHRSFASPIELPVETLILSYDEASAPRVSLRLQTPATAGLANRLDPRTGVRVTLEAGYRRPGGLEDVQPIADLGVRFVEANRPDGSLELIAASDEAMMIDAAGAVATSVNQPTTGLGITALIRDAITPGPAVTVAATGPAVALSPILDRWDTARDLADTIDARVYDDGTRQWFITPSPALAAPALIAGIGPGGLLEDTKDSLDRDAWANYVILRYRWRLDDGTERTIVGTAWVSEGPFSIAGDTGRVISTEDRETPTTQALANAAARSVLSRKITRGVGQQVTGPCAWWLRPGHTIRTTTPDTATRDRIIASVIFQMPSARMQVTTRLPEAATTNVQAGTSTPPAAPPTADPPPPAKNKTRRITTWTASATATFKGSGVKRTDSTDELAQGYFPGTVNGNQRALALFAAANGAGSDAGKTITQALAGVAAEDLEAIEVGLIVTHTWSKAGGTIRLGMPTGTAMPSTYALGSPTYAATVLPSASTRWFKITSPAGRKALLTGASRLVLLGPGQTSGTDYLKTRAAGVQLRLTYSK